ncbi:MAG: hypothetical protein KDA88_08740 [Planctomycetaceae bacterium]|nr:hypothetical protein [Planctomycetaceae bacterium]MCB9949981.1 hypothetical protein [Planctomycetaceae bacterium]
MDPESLARLKRNLAAATDDALVALANRGLVRRAAKDLEKLQNVLVIETEDAIQVRAEDWVVTMPPEGPAAATDDTPASGVTRQIIAATMYLRDRWLPTALESSLRDDVVDTSAVDEAIGLLSEADFEDLAKWAGKTPLWEASAAFPAVGLANISKSPHLEIVFAVSNVHVVLMTDAPAKTLKRLLEQFKTTAGREEHAKWVLLAVLALKESAGRPTKVDTSADVTLTDAVREDRQRVSRRVRELLRVIVTSGAAHPSSRTVERLRTTGVAAEAARFPRLARLLTSIADDAELQIARHAGADPGRMIQRMVSAFALAEAGSSPENASNTELFGRSRTRYHSVGELQLSGLGAYGWQTASGFEGLTALFWDQNARQFLTASVSRNKGVDRSFSIPRAYEGGLGWSGGSSVAAVCRSELTLQDAKVNDDGRLSVAESCRSIVGEPVDPAGLDFGDRLVTSWSELSEIARASQPLGLRLPDPRSSLVIIQPTSWGNRWFDELEQAFIWEVFDSKHAVLDVVVPWREVDEPGIAFLESIKGERDNPTAIFGRLEMGRDKLRVYPFSVFSSGTAQGDQILCPHFDQDRIRSRNEDLLQRLRQKYNRNRVVDTRIGDSEDDEQPGSTHEELLKTPPALRRVLVDIQQVVNFAIESGVHRLNPSATQTLTKCRDQLESLAVTPLAEGLSATLQSHSPDNLLHTAYRLQLFLQTLRIQRTL